MANDRFACSRCKRVRSPIANRFSLFVDAAYFTRHRPLIGGVTICGHSLAESMNVRRIEPTSSAMLAAVASGRFQSSRGLLRANYRSIRPAVFSHRLSPRRHPEVEAHRQSVCHRAQHHGRLSFANSFARSRDRVRFRRSRARNGVAVTARCFRRLRAARRRARDIRRGS